MIHSGITSGTPTRILFGAGVYFQGVAYDEKVAPTEEEIKAAIFGATQEGGTFSITPEFYAPELDGATVALKELQKKIGETAQMEVSFAELTADNVAHMVIGKKGVMLKEIASRARTELEGLFDTKVNLQCWVKVKEDWRNRQGFLSGLGYKLD